MKISNPAARVVLTADRLPNKQAILTFQVLIRLAQDRSSDLQTANADRHMQGSY